MSDDTQPLFVANGSNSDLNVGYGSSGQKCIRPCAYNNPSFVDLLVFDP